MEGAGNEEGGEWRVPAMRRVKDGVVANVEVWGQTIVGRILLRPTILTRTLTGR